MTTSSHRACSFLAASLAAALLVGACAAGEESVATTTTTATTEPEAEPWVGETLDGEPVTIVDGPGPPSFQGGVPTAVFFIDEAATEGGCDALQLEYQWWEGQVADTEEGSWASAYADYALDRRAELGCT